MIDVIKENVLLKWYFIALLEEIEKEITELEKNKDKGKSEICFKNYLNDLRKYITDALTLTVEGIALSPDNKTQGILKDLLNNEI